MFLKELIEDYEFEDIKFVFENDKYFLYSSERYSLSEEDEMNFVALKESNADFLKYSLEVVSLSKMGLLSRVVILDHEDEVRSIEDISLEDLSGFPVDMVYSSNNRRAIQLIISILLEHTFYMDLERRQEDKNK